jgi:ABC-type bacteriocin/lantibiotic exporter with double-glycine peptidase domain
VPQSPIVEISNVSFGYDPAKPVLRDIDLAIARGAVVGIMGQSGCGKTTLLRVIMGALRPTAGSARARSQHDCLSHK